MQVVGWGVREADGVRRERGKNGGEGIEDIVEGQGGREGEAGAVTRALIGHLLCYGDSSRHLGKLGGEGGQDISEAWWETEDGGRKCRGRG